MTQAWTSGVEKTWKSLSGWVNAASWHGWILSCADRLSGVSAGLSNTHVHACYPSTALTKHFGGSSSWLVLNQTYSGCHATETIRLRQTPSRRVQRFPVRWQAVKFVLQVVCWKRFVLHRSGSVEGLWRSLRALTWVTCSERPRPTHFPEERDRSSTKIIDGWQKSGWMSLRTFSTLSHLVSWAERGVCGCVSQRQDLRALINLCMYLLMCWA